MPKRKEWKDEDYKNFPQKWNSKEEYDIVKRVLNRTTEMADARRSSCPWSSPFAPSVETSTSSRTGTDWGDIWNIDDSNFYMLREYYPDRSNLQSSLVFATTMAFLTEFQENQITTLFTPTEREDTGKVKIIKAKNTDWENRYDLQSLRNTTMMETVIRGTSIPFNGWQLKTRKVDLIMSSKMTKKELEKMKSERSEELEHAKDTIMREQRPLIKREEIIEMNDAVYVPTDLFEIFLDPDARVLRGPAYEASDIYWRQLPSEDQFKSEFKNSTDPFVIKSNINRVKASRDAHEAYQTGAAPFIVAPEDAEGSKIVLIRYYNKIKDEYVIIANDVLIRKGPMPYNHKQLPFSVHKFYELKNHIYGFGIPRILEGDKAEIETLSNMRLDQRKIEINPPVFVNTDVFADVDRGWEVVRAGMKVEVGGDVGPGNIRWMDKSTPDFDTPRAIEDIRQDAIQASGINPLAYSVPKAGEPVRTHILAMESTLKQIKRGIKNWAAGEIDATRQRIRLWQQYLPESYVQDVDDNTGKKESEKKYPTIRTEGVKMSYEDGEVFEEKVDGFEYFDLKDEYLDLEGEVDVQIDSDSLVPRSYGLKVQQTQEAMTILPAILADERLMAAPGVSTLVKEYISLMGLDSSISDQLQDESGEQSIIAAEMQNEAMLAGEVIPGIPGESNDHIMQHYQLLNEKLSERDKARKGVEAMVDPFGNMLPPSPKTISEMQKQDRIVDLLREHIAQDATPKPEAVPAILAASQPQQQQPQQMGAPMQPQAPQGGGMMPPEMGGMMPMAQAVPNMPGMM